MLGVASKLSKIGTIQRKEMIQLKIDRNRAQKSKNATSQVSEHYTEIDMEALWLRKTTLNQATFSKFRKTNFI